MHFLDENIILIAISLKFVPVGPRHQTDINSWWPNDAVWWPRFLSKLVKVMAFCLMVPNHYLNQCWLTITRVFCHWFQDNIYFNTRNSNPQFVFEIYTFEIKATCPRGQWVNSLWPSDAIWQQRSGSTLAQVMACCLTAPSHYLKQCWLIINQVEKRSKGKFTRDNSAINHWNYLKNLST